MGKRIKAVFYPEKNFKAKKYYRRIFRLILFAIIANLVVVLLHVHSLYQQEIDQQFVRFKNRVFHSGKVIDHKIKSDSLGIKFRHELTLFAGHSYDVDSITNMFDRDLHDLYFSHTDSTTIDPKTNKPASSQYGIDVSDWQQKINWPDVHADSLPKKLKFFIIKATQGASIIDAYFKYNWENAKNKNTTVGAYHFYIYKDDPKKQAENYINTVSLASGDILPILDVELDCAGCTEPEIPKEQIIRDLKIYLKTIEDHFKVKPIIYTYTYFYDEYLKGYFDDYVFWMSQFSTIPPEGLPLKGSTDPVIDPLIGMWQFTNDEQIKGIVGHVDMNYIPVHFLDSLLY